MMKFIGHRNFAAIFGVGLVAALSPAAPAAAHDPACDRVCLTGMITNYVDALVAKDPSALPLSDNVKFTEDGYAVDLGKGLWETVTGKESFRQDYIDTDNGLAAAHVELREGDIPVLYSFVLHVDGQEITGIETLIQRITPESVFQPTQLGGPIRGMDDPIPAGKKMNREDMIATALTYTEGLRIGSFFDGGTPFANGTYRVENGVVTAGEGCGRGDCGMYAQRIMVHPSILASVAAVDEEAGIVLLWMNFGFTDSYGDGKALVTYEAFKVWGDEIHAINAFFTPLKVGASRFWSSSDPVKFP